MLSLVVAAFLCAALDVSRTLSLCPARAFGYVHPVDPAFIASLPRSWCWWIRASPQDHQAAWADALLAWGGNAIPLPFSSLNTLVTCVFVLQSAAYTYSLDPS